MRQSQRPSYNSGQPPQNLFVRATSDISSLRQQQPSRFSQPNDIYNNMSQQQSIRMPNTGLPSATRQQSSNTV
jgi:hypothetical protein